MFDRKNDVARNKKRADAIVYAGAADEVVLTQSDFESEEEFRRWKAWSDADYKSDATMAWGDNDTSSQPLDDWRGVSAAFVKWRSGAMTLCRKRLGLRSE